jgi:hypothetical protein
MIAGAILSSTPHNDAAVKRLLDFAAAHQEMKLTADLVR